MFLSLCTGNHFMLLMYLRQHMKIWVFSGIPSILCLGLFFACPYFVCPRLCPDFTFSFSWTLMEMLMINPGMSTMTRPTIRQGFYRMMIVNDLCPFLDNQGPSRQNLHSTISSVLSTFIWLHQYSTYGMLSVLFNMFQSAVRRDHLYYRSIALVLFYTLYTIVAYMLHQLSASISSSEIQNTPVVAH